MAPKWLTYLLQASNLGNVACLCNFFGFLFIIVGVFIICIGFTNLSNAPTYYIGPSIAGFGGVMVSVGLLIMLHLQTLHNVEKETIYFLFRGLECPTCGYRWSKEQVGRSDSSSSGENVTVPVRIEIEMPISKHNLVTAILNSDGSVWL